MYNKKEGDVIDERKNHWKQKMKFKTKEQLSKLSLEVLKKTGKQIQKEIQRLDRYGSWIDKLIEQKSKPSKEKQDKIKQKFKSYIGKTYAITSVGVYSFINNGLMQKDIKFDSAQFTIEGVKPVYYKTSNSWDAFLVGTLKVFFSKKLLIQMSIDNDVHIRANSLNQLVLNVKQFSRIKKSLGTDENALAILYNIAFTNGMDRYIWTLQGLLPVKEFKKLLKETKNYNFVEHFIEEIKGG